MKKALRGTYKRVGRDVFVDGLKNGLRGCMVIILLLILMGVVACTNKKEEPVVVMYELTEERMVWETSPENNRTKVPRVKEVTYLVTEVR